MSNTVLLLSGVRQVAVTCRHGTSVARSLKLLALPQSRSSSIINNITVSTRVVLVRELPYVTNTN